jgi:bifunctional UDP-N-acetylglucosamine pyrophosphorylase/glucosamine-1-phosphate N-acetyltransferase
MRPVAIVLAAGKGTRMKSELPKVAHEVCGRPMIDYVLDAAQGAGCERLVVVVGHGADHVRKMLAGRPEVAFAMQHEQKGTGHAVQMCVEHLRAHDGPVLVVAGDMPLVRSRSLGAILDERQSREAACVIGTATTDANKGLGRIVRDPGGEFLRIVEEKDASPEIAAIREVNTGCYAFDGRALLEALAKLRPNNSQSEYYLTDCAEILKNEGRRVVALDCFDISEALGVNTRAQLADVGREIEVRRLERLMADGVTIVAPESTYVDPRAEIGAETVIHPFTTVAGPCTIGRHCRLGPHAHVEAGARLPDGTVVGPFETAAAE